MTLRTTLGLLLACSVCAAILWLLGGHSAQTSERINRDGKLFPAPLKEIDYLLIERPGFKLELEFGADGWEIKQPQEALASSAAVQQLLDTFEDAPMSGRISFHEMRNRELELDDFGLIIPNARMIIAGPRGRAELLVGNPTSASNEVFCSFANSPEVLVTSARILDALPSNPFTFNDPRVFREDPRRISAIGIRRPGEPYVKLSYDAGGWRITQPITTKADDTVAADIVNVLAQTRIENYVWPESEGGHEASLRNRLLAYGLDNDSIKAELQVWLTGDPVGYYIKIGNTVRDHPDSSYVLLSNGEAIAAVTNQLLKAVSLPLNAIREKRLIPYNPKSLEMVSARSPTNLYFTLRRSIDNDWELSAPVNESADPRRTALLIDSLLTLTAVDFADADLVSSVEELCGIEVGTKADKVVLRQFKALETHPGLVPISVGDDVRLVTTSQWSRVSALVHAPADLRGRTLFKIGRDHIRKIAVIVEGESDPSSIEYDTASGQWRPIGDYEVNQAVLDGWLDIFEDFQATRVYNMLPVWENSEYGFDKPHIQLTIDLTLESAMRRVLIVGNMNQDNERFAIVKGHDTIFVLDAELWRPFTQPLLQNTSAPISEIGDNIPDATRQL